MYIIKYVCNLSNIPDKIKLNFLFVIKVKIITSKKIKNKFIWDNIIYK